MDHCLVGCDAPVLPLESSLLLDSNVVHSFGLDLSMTLRCPYFACQKEFEFQSPNCVHECPHCRRLSIKCEDRNCGALNRPFSLYCRRCNDDMLVWDWAGTADQLWLQASRFGQQAFLAEMGDPEDLIDLSSLSVFRRPKALLAIRFIEGLLAIHQTGGYLAIMHPFVDKSESPLWCDREMVDTPSTERPFDPCKMGDHRHLLFSSPLAVYSVNVWSLKDWAYSAEKPRYKTCIDFGDGRSHRLAQPPIVFDDKYIGVLISTSNGEYQWGVFDIDEPMQVPECIGDCVHLPITGPRCEAHVVADQIIAFATEVGHWVWQLSDARRRDTSSLRQTWPPKDEEGRLIMDASLDDATAFRVPKQFLCCPKLSGNDWPPYFTWYYLKKAHPTNSLEKYRVSFDSLAVSRNVTLDCQNDTIPLGLRGDPAEMLFAADGQLRTDNHGALEKIPIRTAFSGINEASGLYFHDPLITIVETSRTPSRRTITFRSIEHPTTTSSVDVPTIRSDPVVWSHWLFTNEVEEGQSHIIRRRQI